MSDLIRRSDAIDAFGLSEKTRKYGGDHSGYNTMMLYEIQDVLESLPSAEPKIGKWKSTTSGDHYKCSVCGNRAGYWYNEENSCEYSLDMSEWLSDFCPNCGARMEGEEE